MHSIWQKIRRPFRYPRCTQDCKWEIYDVTNAGCLHCGASHTCQKMAFEGNCPLVQCDDGSRVCSITGYVIPEVRYSKEEYMDNIVFPSHCPVSMELDTEVGKYIDKILDSSYAVKCRKDENSYQCKKLYKGLVKSIRTFKLKHPNQIPNVCHLITNMLHQEKRIKFIYPASTELKQKCNQNILLCILDLKSKGYKICIGNKLQDLVCGLVYLLRSGISYQNHELLSPVPEIARCLPIESRLKAYFSINSKVITSVENEVKLAFRDYHQHTSTKH